jgi:hypothetical protein
MEEIQNREVQIMGVNSNSSKLTITLWVDRYKEKILLLITNSI